MKSAAALALICGLIACDGKTSTAASGPVVAPANLPIPTPTDAQVKTPRDAFTVDLPNGFDIYAPPPRIDFAIVDIAKGKVDYVGIYEGNAPSFPVPDGQGGVVEVHATNPVKTLVTTTNGKRRVTEYLWKTGYAWPAYLHVFGLKVPDDQQELSDRIAASIRPTTPKP